MTIKTTPQPWSLPEPTKSQILAVKAIVANNASEDQQRIFINWLVNIAAATYDLPFRPGEGGDRATDFACGKMFVGQQVVRLSKLDVNRYPD